MATRAFTIQERSGAKRREATQDELLAAVRGLLEEGEPLAALSVGRIATRAGVSRATFYLHFPDKHDLITRLARDELLEWESITATFLSNPRAGRAELGQAVRALTRMWKEHAGVLSALIELAEYDAAVRDAWQQTIAAVAETLAAMLAARRPGLSRSDASMLGQMIAWMGERSCHQLIGPDSTDTQLERVANGLTEATWRIMTPASPAA